MDVEEARKCIIMNAWIVRSGTLGFLPIHLNGDKRDDIIDIKKNLINYFEVVASRDKKLN